MNNIQRINTYGQLPAVGQQSSGGVEKSRTAPSASKNEDEVQISDMGAYLGKIAAMPEIRAEKVEAIRMALADGTYDVEGKLSQALDLLLDEHTP